MPRAVMIPNECDETMASVYLPGHVHTCIGGCRGCGGLHYCRSCGRFWGKVSDPAQAL